MYDNNESRRLIWQGAGIRKLTAVSGRMKKRRSSSFSGSRKSKNAIKIFRKEQLERRCKWLSMIDYEQENST